MEVDAHTCTRTPAIRDSLALLHTAHTSSGWHFPCILGSNSSSSTRIVMIMQPKDSGYCTLSHIGETPAHRQLLQSLDREAVAMPLLGGIQEDREHRRHHYALAMHHNTIQHCVLAHILLNVETVYGAIISLQHFPPQSGNSISCKYCCHIILLFLKSHHLCIIGLHFVCWLVGCWFVGLIDWFAIDYMFSLSKEGLRYFTIFYFMYQSAWRGTLLHIIPTLP